MGYTQVALEDKLLDMYPEMRNRSITPRLSFDKSKDAWMVKLVKGGKEKIVCLNKEDADACMDNHFCKNFGSDLKKALAEFS
ncbi:MAG: hypothetical protein A2Y97_04210 [Nitrospirae bacterium RBG_13_39_12]|nr:MAG: hypothetical protein A2Y97_04210 [Nitrospirae bacterium RBG_13_39_12]